MNILFLCVANSARSQIAEGLAKNLFTDKAWIESAGSRPGEQVHPFAIQTLSEIGIDISSNTPKSIQDLPKEFIQNLDLVITLCREEQCPVISGSFKRESWSLPDPADQSTSDTEKAEAFRNTRNEIQFRLTRLKNSI